MGERRWRASQEAGLDTIPAIVRQTDDNDMLRDALLENLHRSQLNPLEEAAAYGQLLEDFGCTHDELAQRIGRSRPQISNTLRLLKLSPGRPAPGRRRRALGRPRPSPADDRGPGPAGPARRSRHRRGHQRARPRGDRLPRSRPDQLHAGPAQAARPRPGWPTWPSASPTGSRPGSRSTSARPRARSPSSSPRSTTCAGSSRSWTRGTGPTARSEASSRSSPRCARHAQPRRRARRPLQDSRLRR